MSDNTKLDNKAEQPTEDKRTKAEIIEQHNEVVKKKDEEILKLKNEAKELKEDLEKKDQKITELELASKDESILVEVEYIKDSCGIAAGFICQMTNADAALMVQKKLVKILD